MDLLTLASRLHQRLQQPLPASVAHEHMRALPVSGPFPNFKHTTPSKPGSVLILLYQEDERIKFPLIKRPVYAGPHSGQVSLPGGKLEAGETFIEAALREADEEAG